MSVKEGRHWSGHVSRMWPAIKIPQYSKFTNRKESLLTKCMVRKRQCFQACLWVHNGNIKTQKLGLHTSRIRIQNIMGYMIQVDWVLADNSIYLPNTEKGQESWLLVFNSVDENWWHLALVLLDGHQVIEHDFFEFKDSFLQCLDAFRVSDMTAKVTSMCQGWVMFGRLTTQIVCGIN
jgi:hypothetical protein